MVLFVAWGLCFYSVTTCSQPIPVAVCDRSPSEIVGLNLAWGRGCLFVVNVVWCQVEVCVTS